MPDRLAIGSGEVLELGDDALSDNRLVELMCDARVSKVGIDAPFGWPAPFIDAITTYRDTGAWLNLEPNELRYRATETRTASEVGQEPLSVATSDLAWPAMRCARLLSQLPEEHGTLDRTGRGRVAEGLPHGRPTTLEHHPAGNPPTSWAYKATSRAGANVASST